MEQKILETDLSKPVCNYLIKQGYEVRSEINHCDISAIKDDQLIIIELKKSLSIELLLQATKRQKIADLVYVAIPKPQKLLSTSKWNDICHLLRRLELGLILVTIHKTHSYIEIVVEPLPFDRQKSIQMNKNKRRRILKEFEGRNKDLNIGGSTGKKLVTAYREAALHIACCIEANGPLSAKMLKQYNINTKNIGSILIKNHYDWFQPLGKGCYDLTGKGKQEIHQYPELIEFYQSQISEQINSFNTERKESKPYPLSDD